MKQKFNVITSTCIPLPLENVDTDQIIPARFLKATDKKGMGDNLGIGEFVRTVVGANARASIFVPAVMFAVALFLAFSSGTSWGTFAILVPIVVEMFNGVDSHMMIIAVSAVLAGAVCGDHVSPISDTTIMSSAGAMQN